MKTKIELAKRHLKDKPYAITILRDDLKKVIKIAEQLLEASQAEMPSVSEKQAENDFRDWLGWEGKSPDKDDPDYYTYSWGMNVWVNALRANKILKSK